MANGNFILSLFLPTYLPTYLDFLITCFFLFCKNLNSCQIDYHLGGVFYLVVIYERT